MLTDSWYQHFLHFLSHRYRDNSCFGFSGIFISKSTISRYYVTAIRAIYITYAVPTLSLRDERIQMFTRALKLIRPFASTIPPFITEETLRQIVQNGMIWFQSAVQFHIFCFIESQICYFILWLALNVTLQLCRGEIFFSQMGNSTDPVVKNYPELEGRKNNCYS